MFRFRKKNYLKGKYDHWNFYKNKKIVIVFTILINKYNIVINFINKISYSLSRRRTKNW